MAVVTAWPVDANKSFSNCGIKVQTRSHSFESHSLSGFRVAADDNLEVWNKPHAPPPHVVNRVKNIYGCEHVGIQSAGQNPSTPSFQIITKLLLPRCLGRSGYGVPGPIGGPLVLQLDLCKKNKGNNCTKVCFIFCSLDYETFVTFPILSVLESFKLFQEVFEKWNVINQKCRADFGVKALKKGVFWDSLMLLRTLQISPLKLGTGVMQISHKSQL